MKKHEQIYGDLKIYLEMHLWKNLANQLKTSLIGQLWIRIKAPLRKELEDL